MTLMRESNVMIIFDSQVCGNLKLLQEYEFVQNKNKTLLIVNKFYSN